MGAVLGWAVGGAGCYLSVCNSSWQLLPHMSRGAGEGRGKGVEKQDWICCFLLP
jgi:hypothetical protein